MKNTYENNFVEEVIANNLQEAQRYFPRLSKFLMSYFMGEDDSFNNITPETIAKYYNVQHFLYHLCVVTEIKDDYVEAFEYFVSKLTNEEWKNKNYLDFEDGYVYDFQMNQNFFYLKLQDACFSFYEFFRELSDISSSFNFKQFKNFVLEVLDEQIKTIQMDSKMQSNEYVEVCFMQALVKVLNDTKHIDTIIDTYSIQD